MSPERVLAEMAALGVAATEAGPDGFLPADGVELRRTLDAASLRLVGGFAPLVLHDENPNWAEGLHTCVDRFAAGGGEVVVLAAATGWAGYDERPRLSVAEWDRLLVRLDEAERLAAARGLRTVLHPHIGTVVENPAEIQRVLDGCGIGLCLDTGHIAAGGGDPVAIAGRNPDRIGHVHAKDVDADAAASVAAGSVAFSDAVRDGMFQPLGLGDVDFPTLLSTLFGAGYDGWYVLEQDVMLPTEPPDGGGPADDVAISFGFLDEAIAAGVRAVGGGQP